jgi:hypothetical protein
MAATANTLIASAMSLGYDSLSDRGLKECLLYAASDGGGGGGGGGSGAVTQGTGAPSSAPTDPTSPAIYTNLTDGVIYTWNVVTQAWI